MKRWSLALAPLFAAALALGPICPTAFGQDDPFRNLADEDAAFFAKQSPASPTAQKAAITPRGRDSARDGVSRSQAEPPSEFGSFPDPFGGPTLPSAIEPLPTIENVAAAAPVVRPVPHTAVAGPQSSIDSLFLFACSALVLLMQAGFAMLEAGFNSSKHTVNNLFKNVLNLSVAAIVFFLVGYHLMFPVTPTKEGYVGQVSPGIDGSMTTSGSPGLVATAPAATVDEQIHFFYRFALAAVAATIVSGAVAGRMRFGASVLCGAAVAGVVYPVAGYWKWGGGWLDDLGFYDFAGAGVVHMTGGFAGLAGAILLGPRNGRYTPDGKPIAIPGHSLPLATLGVFLLFVGWFGFNAGGQLAVSGAGNAASIALVVVNTTLSACAGAAIATGLSWVLFAKPDLSMALSGLLGGLVGIAAGCNGVTNLESLAVGGVSGGAVVLSIILLDKLRIDDPVGAFPVHGVCGMWGLIACSIFGDRAYWGTVNGTENLAYGNPSAQIAGIVAIGGHSFACMLGLFGVLKTVGFLRVSPEEEDRGLDVSEHGLSAYAA